MFKTEQSLNELGQIVEYMERTWVRNGPGILVPHPYKFVWAKQLSAVVPMALNAGYAWPHCSDLDWAMGENRLYSKLKDRSFDTLMLGEDFGERAKSIALIGNVMQAIRKPLQTVGELMKKVARTKKGALTGALGEVASAYLAFKYGVLPLMGTIKGAYDIVANGGTVAHNVKGSTGLRHQYTNSSTSGMTTRHIIGVHNGGITSGFQLLVENPYLHALDKVGLINPASVAWNLAPWTLVLDWFLPIGKLIDSWTDFIGTQRVQPYLTRFCKTEAWQTTNTGLLEFHEKAVWCERVLRAPEFKISGFRLKTDQSKGHIASALAFIVQLGAAHRIR